jgi:hypothetical protein
LRGEGQRGSNCEARLFHAAQLEQGRAVARLRTHEVAQRRNAGGSRQGEQMAIAEEIVIRPLQGVQHQEAADSQGRDG